VDRGADGRDMWYVDLVTVERNGNKFTFRDLSIDVMVPLDSRHYRLLDLDEFADALDSGVLSAKDAADALRRWQRFLDRHLHADRAPSNTWTDFPPWSIRPLIDLQSFEGLPAQIDF
jgi:predicted RNA-binding protein associated with RNAse of E/G family